MVGVGTKEVGTKGVGTKGVVANGNGNQRDEPASLCPASCGRRQWLGVALGLSLGLPLAGELAAQDDPRKLRPQPDDQFVFADGPKKGQVIALVDIVPSDPPIAALPMDPKTKVVRDDSRLNEVLLARIPAQELGDETRSRSADGVVAYSNICTHTGCNHWEWQPEVYRIKCSCHFSEFEIKDGARVVNGPAPRRLPALPVKLVDGVLVVAALFIGRPGFQAS